MITTVYRYYNEDDRLLYVGITGNQVNRLDDHWKNRSWWQEVSYGKFRHYETRDKALQIEASAIALELPKYNKAGATIDDEVYAHFIEATNDKFQDRWHQQFYRNYDTVRKEVYSFSKAPAVYQAIFALDASTEWTEDGEKRIIECDSCKHIFESKWFKQLWEAAHVLITDEAELR